MTLKVEIYEVNYAVSPGGVDCWEATIKGYGYSSNASDFKTAGEALDWVLDRYPERLLELTVISQSYYQKELADA